MSNFNITVTVDRNGFPALIAALPQMLDDAQQDLIKQLEDNALNVVPIGVGPEHDNRLAFNATLFQSHHILRPGPALWDLINDALHAGLVYYGNPLSPPRPWFEWALSMTWDWYASRLQRLAADLESLAGR